MSTEAEEVLSRIRMRTAQKQDEDKDQVIEWQKRDIQRLRRQNLLLKRVNGAMLRAIEEFNPDE